MHRLLQWRVYYENPWCEGAVFRAVDRYNKVAATGLHGDSIAEILKTAATRAGINSTNIAGHSVRAGMATQARTTKVAAIMTTAMVNISIRYSISEAKGE